MTAITESLLRIIRFFLTGFTFCLIVHNGLLAQVSLTVDIQGPITNASCDGSVVVTATGIGDIYGISNFMPQTQSDFNFTGSAIELNDVCEGEQFNGMFEIENESCFRILVGSLGDIMQMGSLYAGEDIEFTLNITMPSGPFASDGEIEVVTSEISEERVSLYTLSADLAGFLLLDTTNLVSQGHLFSDLSVDSYVIALTDTIEWKYFGIGLVLESVGTMGCMDSLAISPHVQSDLGIGGCTGSVEIVDWGAVGPFSYSHDPIAANTNELYGLCTGLYSVTVTDAANNTAYAEYIIPDQTDLYNSVNWPFDPGLDTLFANAVGTCDLDFNQPIDSVFVMEVTILDSISFGAHWVFFQGGVPYSIHQNYFYQELGPAILSLGVYCENGRASEFGSFFVYDEFDLSLATSTGEIQITESGISVFPNPSMGKFRLTGTKAGTMYSVYSLHGQHVLNSVTKTDNDVVDLSNYNDGIYVLTVQSTDRRQNLKLINHSNR